MHCKTRKKRSFNPIRDAIENYFEQKFSPTPTQDQTSSDYYYDEETDSGSDTDAYPNASSSGAQHKIIASPEYRELLQQASDHIRAKQKLDNSKLLDKQKTTTVSSVDRQGEAGYDQVTRLSNFFDPYTILAGLAFATYLGVLVYLAAIPPANDISNLYKTTRTVPMALKEPEAFKLPQSIHKHNFLEGTLDDLKAQHPGMEQGQMVLVGKLVNWNSLQNGIAGHDGAILLPVGTSSSAKLRARRTVED